MEKSRRRATEATEEGTLIPMAAATVAAGTGGDRWSTEAQTGGGDSPPLVVSRRESVTGSG
jgi:hypothetical protein